MNQKIILYVLFTFFGFFIALVLQRKSDTLMEPGTKIPELQYEGEMGKETLNHESKKTTVIVWFHPDCEHCLYQLQQINNQFHLFKGTKFFFFTEDKEFPASKHLGLWPNLTSSDQVRFGILERHDFTSNFGKVVTPTTFIFNRQGNLEEKFIGEVKIDKIKQVIEDLNLHDCEKRDLNSWPARRMKILSPERSQE